MRFAFWRRGVEQDECRALWKRLAFWRKRGRQSCAGERIHGSLAPKRVVTLVHGTYAKHADWVQPDSDLAETIAEDGETAVTAFCWSGCNSHADRLRAAGGLGRRLTELHDQFSDAQHYVVAHSHGGNVALYAMRDDKLLDKMREKGGGIVTLATPFLHVRWRPLATLIGGLLAWATVVSVVALIVLVVGALAGEFGWWWWIALVVVASGVLATVPLVISAMTYRGSAVPKRAFLPFGKEKLLDGKTKEKWRDEEFELLKLPNLSPDELLVLRATADEASELLVSAQFFSWILTKYLQLLGLLQGIIGKSRKDLIGLAFAATFVAGSISQTAEGIVADVLNVATVVIVLAFLGFSAAALPGLGLMVVTAASFGRDGLFWPLYVEMTAEAAPVGLAHVKRADVSSDTGLSHSNIYDDADVIAAIVVHLRGEQAPQAS